MQAVIKLPLWLRQNTWKGIYIGIAVWFIASLLPNKQCGVGFTSMIAIGDRFYENALPAFKEASPRVFAEGYGYDAQFYAQIALDPTLRNPQLSTAVDTLSYRGRRILMPLTAWVMGGGDPRRILQIYPLINPLCWLLSAILLLRWLPPTGFQNALRWGGVLLGWGWITSVERSLTDGPAATLTLLAALLISKGAATQGAIAIAASALTKDASLLTGLGLCFKRGSLHHSILQFFKRGLICILPFVIWWLYVKGVAPSHEGSTLGTGNFAPPFQAFFIHVKSVAIGFYKHPSPQSLFALACYAGLLAQILFIILRPRPRELWWRLGIGTAVLGTILGIAVWEDIPGAAPRVLLVLHIAFNITAPYRRRWIPLLLIGNISVIDFPRIMQPPELSQYSLDCIESKNFIYTGSELEGSNLTFKLIDGWHTIESSKHGAFVWSKDTGTIRITNHSPETKSVTLTLKIGTHYARNCRVFWNDMEIDNFEQTQSIRDYTTNRVFLKPGANLLKLTGDYPARQPNKEDQRNLGISFYSVKLHDASTNDGIIKFQGMNAEPPFDWQFGDGWYEKESFENDHWRWAKESAEIHFLNQTEKSSLVVSKIKIRSISSSEVTLTCNGSPLFAKTIGSTLIVVETPPFELKPGSNTIHFVSKTLSRKNTTDTRDLNLALYELILQPATTEQKEPDDGAD